MDAPGKKGGDPAERDFAKAQQSPPLRDISLLTNHFLNVRPDLKSHLIISISFSTPHLRKNRYRNSEKLHFLRQTYLPISIEGRQDISTPSSLS